jgi:hypothetical protein
MGVLSVTKEDHGGPSEEHTILSSNHEDDGTEGRGLTTQRCGNTDTTHPTVVRTCGSLLSFSR